jgi:hypothetical protein
MKFKGHKFGRGASTIEIDYALWWKKTEKLLNQLIPFARVTARAIAVKTLEKIEERTPETYEGRTDIKDLWEMYHKKLKTREDFLIRNLYPDQQVIMWFEEGTDPHDITPKEGSILHFKIRGKGNWVKTDLVKHPGTEAHKMIEGAEQDMAPAMKQYVTQTFALAQRIMNLGR